ncbi:hypothetical protein ES703_46225 [subsurface metagenome]
MTHNSRACPERSRRVEESYYYLLQKTKTYDVTLAKAGGQDEKAGFPLPRE